MMRNKQFRILTGVIYGVIAIGLLMLSDKALAAPNTVWMEKCAVAQHVGVKHFTISIFTANNSKFAKALGAYKVIDDIALPGGNKSMTGRIASIVNTATRRAEMEMVGLDKLEKAQYIAAQTSYFRNNCQ